MNTKPTGRWLLDWRPGYALPSRFTTSVDGDWLPYFVELDVAARDGGMAECVAIRVTAREGGEPVTARGIRNIPLGECLRLAIGSTLSRLTFTERREAGQATINLDWGVGVGADTTKRMQLASRGPQRRMLDDWLREAAEIYRNASEKPTQAVQRLHSQAPISYSTAARWVMQARRRGFLSPVERRADQSDKD